MTARRSTASSGAVCTGSVLDLRDGMQVQFSNFNLYDHGAHELRGEDVLAGGGGAAAQVAALAEKLRREGLMDEARKRPIPAFCTRVAVVTSLSGAVIDDVKRTLRRRNPWWSLCASEPRSKGRGRLPSSYRA